MEFLGREVEREFAGHGKFRGRVVEYDAAHGFCVEYQDGDREHLKKRELLRVLRRPSKTAPLPPPTPKYESAPSVSLDEYVRNARTAARRKRKRTELKRSGVLEAREARDAQLREAAEAAEAAAAAVRNIAPMRPPAWAHNISLEGRAVRCAANFVNASGARLDAISAERSLYRLELESCTPTSAKLRWSYPLGMPGDHGAWLGLYPASCVAWNSECGEVAGNSKVLWRPVTGRGFAGVVTLKRLPPALPDGDYVFALLKDYGVQCVALSERMRVKDGRVATVICGTALFSEEPKMERRQRQVSASLELKQLLREKDSDSEPLHEGQCFPITAVDVTLPRDYAEQMPLIKDIYRIVDRESYLDWGLTSDYESAKVAKRTAEKPSSQRTRDAATILGVKPSRRALTQYSELLPTAAQHAAKSSMREELGLGGGTRGSEGYGEATIGSVQKIAATLQHLRRLVLQDLADVGWSMIWDLGPWSSFLDIGSGYGKVVLHINALVRMRAAVGYECVNSRHEIGTRAKQLLEAELALKSKLEAADAQRDSEIAESTVQGEGGVGDGAVEGAPNEATDAAVHGTVNGTVNGGVNGTVNGTGAALGSESAQEIKGEIGAEMMEEIKENDAAAENGLMSCTGLEGGGRDGGGDAGFAPCKRTLVAKKVRKYAAVSEVREGVSWECVGAFDAAELRHGDVTKEERLLYTHIYIFDWVFSKHTLREIAALLQASPFYVLLSFRSCAEWWSYGLSKVQPVAKIPGFRTSGKESMTCFVYVNLEKVPAPAANC